MAGGKHIRLQNKSASRAALARRPLDFLLRKAVYDRQSADHPSHRHHHHHPVLHASDDLAFPFAI